MNLLNGEAPAAKRFRLGLSNEIDEQNFGTSKSSNSIDNNNRSSSRDYNENDGDGFCLKLEGDAMEEGAGFSNCDENEDASCHKEQNFDSNKNFTEESASLMNNNYEGGKNNIAANKAASSFQSNLNALNASLPFDLLKLINSTKTQTNGLNEELCIRENKSNTMLAQRNQFSAINNNNSPFSLFNGANFLNPHDLAGKSSSGRRGHGGSSNSSVSPPPALQPQFMPNSSVNGSKFNNNEKRLSASPNATPLLDLSFAMSLFQQANSLFNNNNNNNKGNNNIPKNGRNLNNEIKAAAANLLTRGISSPSSQRSRNTTPGAANASPTPVPIPGAVAVAASPAAILFSQDDWSWHRNPAASIRSGGTNKQTPVWKYFVYNKAENLSRCIVGSCTYTLKGPHTSTLACHLKKHPTQYAEFQKLKAVYTRERNNGQMNSNGNNGIATDSTKHSNSLSANSSLASASPSSNASSSGLTASNVSQRDAASPSTPMLGGLNLLNKLSNKTECHNSASLVQNNNNNSGNNLANLGALNFVYAAAAAAAAANNNSVKLNNTNGNEVSGITNLRLPYAGIFGNENLSNSNLQSSIAAAMSAAAASLSNNYQIANDETKQNNKMFSETTARKANQNNGKSSTSMSIFSDILAALNRRAAAAAAATSSEASSNIKNSPPSSPLTNLQTNNNNNNGETLLSSKFPTLEELFRIDENNEETARNSFNSKSPSKLFHSVLELSTSNTKSDDVKDVMDSRSVSRETTSPVLLTSQLTGNQSQHQQQHHQQLLTTTAAQQQQQQQHQQQSVKKWQRQDRRQRELEIKLALTMSGMELPLGMIKNAFLKELLETAQPKFTMPTEIDQLDDIINIQHSRTICALKLHLNAATQSKIALMVNITTPNTKNNNECLTRIMVLATFYSTIMQRIETAVLAIRFVEFKENISGVNAESDEIQNVIGEVLKEYELDLKRISKIIFSNNLSNNFCLTSTSDDNKDSAEFNNRLLKSFGMTLLHSLQMTIDSDSTISQLKQSLNTMISAFSSNPATVSQLNESIATNLDIDSILLSPTSSFYSKAKFMLEIQDAFLMVCCQQNFLDIEVFDDNQWAMLSEFVQMVSLFNTYFHEIEAAEQFCIEPIPCLSQISPMPAIDGVIPALRKIEIALTTEFHCLNELANQLKKTIHEECAYILDVESSNFDKTFVQATALNPIYAKKYLSEKQYEYAISSIKDIINDEYQIAKSCSNNISEELKSSSELFNNETLEAPKEKLENENEDLVLTTVVHSNSSASDNQNDRINQSTLCSNLIEVANKRIRELEAKQSIETKTTNDKSVVQCYFDELSQMSDEQTLQLLEERSNLFAFWQQNANEKSVALSSLAIELLSIPATSIHPNSILIANNRQLAIKDSSTNKHNLQQQLKESERNVILRFNRQFLPKLNV